MTDSYVLLSTSSIHQTMEEIGVKYSRKAAVTVIESPTGYIRRIGDIAIYVSKSRKLLMVPADRATAIDLGDRTLPAQRKRFYYFLMQARKNGDDALAQRFKEDARSLLPPTVWGWEVTATALGEPRDLQVDVKGRPGLVPLRMEGYLLLPVGQERASRARMGATLGADETLVLDADDLFVLCQKKLDILYLQEQLKATPRSAVLLVLAKQDDRVVGIRATRLAWGHGKKQKVHGIYACSSGFGTHIQAYTEELLRTDLLPVLAQAQGSKEGYGTSAYTMRARPTITPAELPAFTLHAIPSAAPIWKSAFGFTDTQKKKGQMSLLTKSIAPATVEERATTKKRKASKSPSSMSSAAGM